jgi:predicted CXXCH cytochrome family protein
MGYAVRTTKPMIVIKGSGMVLLLLLVTATGIYSEQSASYVGENKCATCHSAITDTWKDTRHAKAIESLKKSGQETLPACVKCHVTGYEKDGGFVDYELTPEMAGVQCEVCHGPGSDHVANPMAKNIIKKSGAELCRKCHTEGQDPAFSYEVKVKDVHGK